MPPEGSSAGAVREVEAAAAFVGLARIEALADELETAVGTYVADVAAREWAAAARADHASNRAANPSGGTTNAAGGGAFSVDYARWQRLHECEQPGNWYANGGNRADPGRQTFQGGLGMSTDAWAMAVRAAAARGLTLPGSALSASPEQQMAGAQAFYDAYGWGWACHV